MAGRGPHQPTAVVVDDHGALPVALLVGDLVDPDPSQAGEAVNAGSGLLGHPRDAPPDRAPGHRSTSLTAALEVWTASQAVVSSNAQVKPVPWRAHGTRATTTPCSGQRTLGASATK